MKLKQRLIFGTTLLLIGVFAGATYLYKAQKEHQSALVVKANQELLVRPYSATLGPSNAPVTIVEFLDPECESCATLYPMVKKLMKEFHGKVRLVVRYMAFHQNSVYAASVLEAVRQRGMYWQALELLFARQSEWASHQNPRPELIMGYMKSLGLDSKQIENSLTDFVYRSKVQQDQADGSLLGVTGTPTFFVNGKILKKVGYGELRKAVKIAVQNSE